jgi:hypothetical protein
MDTDGVDLRPMWLRLQPWISEVTPAEGVTRLPVSRRPVSSLFRPAAGSLAGRQGAEFVAGKLAVGVGV